MKAMVGSRAYMSKSLSPSQTPEGARLDVGQVDGALLGISVDHFNALRGFDEQFELYYEDVDICLRAAAIGGCVYVSEEWGIHVGGASSASVSALAYSVARVSRVRFLRKHYGVSRAVRMATIAVALLELAARTATGQPEGLRVRSDSVRSQLAELTRPGSVQVLA